jgi:hypothetical protein
MATTHNTTEDIMGITLDAAVPRDGTVCLNWNGEGSPPTQWWLLVERTGARPGYTSLTLDGGVKAWRFENLSRHQRYRIQVRAPGDQASACVDVLPREGSTAVTEQGAPMPQAGITQLLVMPQDRRLTAYWTLSSGFVDRTVVAVHVEGRLLGRWELEPEVRSLSVDAARVAALQNGMVCDVTVATRLGTVVQDVMTVRAVPAPQGRERDANRALTQAGLVYPCLSLTDELDLFGDANAPVAAARVISCGSCGGATAWRDYTLTCTSCAVRFIRNARGDFLDLSKLRFGTCRCCLPHKILIQDAGSTSLRCSHSGKEHIRLEGETVHRLIEDLPYGLCQCCRPRRPLRKDGDNVRCSVSREMHRRAAGDVAAFVLVPSAPVLDAAAIDELMDAGLADICATGVSRARR